jgi:glutaredoxin
MQSRRLLFRLARCPYCRRAEEALDKAKISYEKIDIDADDRRIVELLSGQSSVPILVEVIGSISQDDDIVAYAEEHTVTKK